MRSEPDAKSRHFVALFRNALRSTATIAYEKDEGEGACLGIAGVTVPADFAGLDPSRIDLAFGPGLTRIRLSRTDDDLVQGNFKKMEEHSRGSLRPRDRVPGWVLTVEGSDSEAVAAALETLKVEFGSAAVVDASAIMERLSEYRPPDAV